MGSRTHAATQFATSHTEEQEVIEDGKSNLEAVETRPSSSDRPITTTISR